MRTHAFLRPALFLTMFAACTNLTDATSPRVLTLPGADAVVGALGWNVTSRVQGNWRVTMTDLGTLTSGGQSSAYAINELGEITGTADDAAGHAARPIWVNGVIVDSLTGTPGTPYAWNDRRETAGQHIVSSRVASSVFWVSGASGQLPPLPGGRTAFTFVNDVNASGEMAGGAEGRFGTQTEWHVVTWKNGVVFRDVGRPAGARSATAYGINDAGDLAGYYVDAQGRYNAFVHRNGQFTTLQPLPGQFATYARDINNRGDVVGTSNGGWPVVWPAGSTTPTQLPVPAQRYPRQIWRISDNGDVVGSMTALPPYFESAVLWRNGEFIDLGVWPGGIESYARGVNSAGQIVGVSNLPVGVYGLHAMLWNVTPVAPNTAPVVTLRATTPTSIVLGQSVTFEGSVTDPDAGGGPWPWRFAWGDGKRTQGSLGAPGLVTRSWTYAQRGTFRVRFGAMDGAAAADTSAAVTVVVR